MDTITLRQLMIRDRLTVKEGSISQRTAHLEKALRLILPPKNQSDRTCFRKVATWLGQKCSNDLFNPDEVLPRVIDFALEASSPGANNCHAVFMSILKKELNYPK
jgi:hypothetical protein